MSLVNWLKCWLNTHKYIKTILVLTCCTIVVIVGSVVYDEYFNYEKVPYCESGYELENGKCTKLLVSELVGYGCDDNEIYYNVEDRKVDCRMKEEFVVEPTITEYCSENEKEIMEKDSDGHDKLMCRRSYGDVKPYKRYTCPDGYTEKTVIVGNTDGKHLCILNSVKDKEYQVNSTPICPSGYTYQVVDYELQKGINGNLCSGGTCYYSSVEDYLNSNYGSSGNSYKQVDIMGCGKTESIEPKYKKVQK